MWELIFRKKKSMPQSRNKEIIGRKTADNPPNVLTKLPDTINHTIFSFLDSASQDNMAKFYCTMFGNRHLHKSRIELRLSQFIAAGQIDKIESLLHIRPDLHPKAMSILKKEIFKLAALAKQDILEKILRLYPSLLLEYETLTDFSNKILSIKGREGITILQHAIWARDIHYMCNMMLNCLPNNEEGEGIRKQLVRQFLELKQNGLTYDGKEQPQMQFSLQPLKAALSSYIDNKKPGNRMSLCCQIGLAQRLLPANIWHHYCDPIVSFSTKPNFREKEFRRKLNILHLEDIDSSFLKELGTKYAVTRGDSNKAYFDFTGRGMQATLDLAAIIVLDEARTEDLEKFYERIQRPLYFPSQSLQIL